MTQARQASADLLAALQAQCPPQVQLRSNTNRQTLVSLRQSSKTKRWTLSIRPELLLYPGCEGDLLAFIKQRGKGSFPHLQHAVQDLFSQLQQQQHNVQVNTVPDAIQNLPTVGGQVDLEQRLSQLHAQYWPHLPMPHIGWARNPGPRPLRSIRFGCYRSLPRPFISIHPRLQQSWVAACFLDHVIHHELCHHAQHCQPQPGLRREAIHSPRFRAWEQLYEYYRQARTWERFYVAQLLDPGKARPAP